MKLKPIHYHHENGLMVQKKRRWPFFALIALGITVIIIGLLYVFWPRTASAPEPEQESVAVVEEPENEPVEPEVAAFDAAKLKAVLDGWVQKQSGTASVVIAEENGTVLAKHNADEVMFAASLYKLYVAYEGYRRVDDGTFKLNEPYLNGWTREKCLDEMIRSSHSPCAEKMWVEIGKEKLTSTLETYGITNTSMTGITTTASDAAKMLARIQTGEGLSEASQKAYLASMKGQIYDDALKKGFAQQIVYDKVGFREDVEYHDVGIIEFEDGRKLIVSVMTKNVGTTSIVALAQAITQATE
jgi:beta-lactamase class A